MLPVPCNPHIPCLGMAVGGYGNNQGHETEAGTADRNLDTESVVYIGRQVRAVPHFEAKTFRVRLYSRINGCALLCGEFWRSAGTMS